MNRPGDVPAFPVADVVHPNNQIQYGTNGMTLRDYFAAKAMQGIVQHVMFDQGVEDRHVQNGGNAGDLDKFAAFLAYDMAEAMLEEKANREKLMELPKA